MPFKNAPMKPETLERRAAQRLAEQKQSAVAGYNSYRQKADRYYGDYLVTRKKQDREFANDWQEGAQRYAERAKELGIELEPVALFEAVPDERE